MRINAEKALELDPLLAEAHAALGMIHSRDAHWDQAEQSFKRALDLDPNRAMTRKHLVMQLLLPLGRIQEALEQVRLTEKIDPV
jgi:tetratricopeptide (TPR) repeat protein